MNCRPHFLRLLVAAIALTGVGAGTSPTPSAPVAAPPAPVAAPPAPIAASSAPVAASSAPVAASPSSVAAAPAASVGPGTELGEWIDSARPICVAAYLIAGLSADSAAPGTSGVDARTAANRCIARFAEDPPDARAHRALERLETQLRRMCEPSGACRVHRPVPARDGIELAFDDGFQVDFHGIDDGYEAVVKRAPGEDIRASRARVRIFVFDAAWASGLLSRVGEKSWNGSAIGLEPPAGFSDDVALLRNWVADLANDFELGAGFLAAEFLGPSPRSLTASRRAAVRELLDRYDRRRIGDSDFLRRLDGLLSAPQIAKLERGVSSTPVAAAELRLPANADERERIASLVDARLDRLRLLGKSRVPLRTEPARVAPGYLASRLRRCVEESGLAWDAFLPFLSPAGESGAAGRTR